MSHPENCPTCGGSGRALVLETWPRSTPLPSSTPYQTCATCGGNGYVEDPDSEDECPLCHGDGNSSSGPQASPCSRCGGTGRLAGTGEGRSAGE